MTSQTLSCPAGFTIVHPFTGLPVACPTAPANYDGPSPYVWEFVLLELPFGSFVPGQPPAAISVSASMSDHADLGEPLPIEASSGFRYGKDALDNPDTDPPILQTTPSTASVTPTLLILTKSFNGPENETATGPNWVRRYTIDVAIAPGQTITNLDVTDLLPNTIQYQALISVLVEGSDVTAGVGANCGGGADYWIEAQPASDAPYNAPNNELSVVICEVEGSGGSDVEVTFSFYVPEYDATGASILNPLLGGCVTIPNQAEIASATWDPIDDRDQGSTFSADKGDVDQEFDACALVIQKDVGVVGDQDSPPSGPSPTDTLEYTYAIQVSDYFTLGGPGAGVPQAKSLLMDDVFSDGQLFDATFSPTYEVDDRNGPTNGSFTPGVVFTTDVNLVVNDSQQPAGSFQSGRACGDGTTALQFDLSQQLIDDDRLVALFNIVDGEIDFDGSGVVNADDDGTISAISIFDGRVDLNNSGAADIDDDSPPTFFPIAVDGETFGRRYGGCADSGPYRRHGLAGRRLCRPGSTDPPTPFSPVIREPGRRLPPPCLPPSCRTSTPAQSPRDQPLTRRQLSNNVDIAVTGKG